MHVVTLARSTSADYALLYDRHIAPYLGHYKLVELAPEIIGRWQAERIAAGAGRTSVLKALTLLGGILQRAMESGRIARNPVRLVRKAARPPRREVRPLAPVTVEALRDVSLERDAALISILAYAGLRPQEALALIWAHVRERTILVERAVSLGDLDDTKTDAHRTVRLLEPLAEDLERWRRLSEPCSESALVFPGIAGKPWTRAAYKDWTRKTARGTRRRDGKRSGRGGAFGRAAIAASVPEATPVRATAFVRVLAPARRPTGDVRRAAARPRCAAHAEHVWSRDRRAGRCSTHLGRGRDQERPSQRVSLVCHGGPMMRHERMPPGAGLRSTARPGRGSRRPDSNRGPLHYE
jgi:integrase